MKKIDKEQLKRYGVTTKAYNDAKEHFKLSDYTLLAIIQGTISNPDRQHYENVLQCKNSQRMLVLTRCIIALTVVIIFLTAVSILDVLEVLF